MYSNMKFFDGLRIPQNELQHVAVRGSLGLLGLLPETDPDSEDENGWMESKLPTEEMPNSLLRNTRQTN